MSEEQVDYSQEEWQPVPGFEGSYEVSNMGRVRSLDRVVTCRNGMPKTIHGKILKPMVNPHGYESVAPCIDNVNVPMLVHRLVASVFVKNPDNLPQVDHKDADKRNNCADNLRWVTAKENSENRTYHYRLEHPLPEQWEPNPDDVVFFETEVWRPIPGYDKEYEISSRGRVRSLDRVIERGEGTMTIHGREVKQCLSSAGYKIFNLHHNNKSKRVFTHKVMGEVFLPNPNGFTEVMHKNHERTDNRTENLLWCPTRYGTLAAVRDGVIDPQKDRRGKPTPYETQRKGIAVVRDDGKRYESIAAAARDIGLSTNSVRDVLKGCGRSCGGHTFRYADEPEQAAS